MGCGAWPAVMDPVCSAPNTDTNIQCYSHTRVFLGTYCCSASCCLCWSYFIMSYRRYKIYLRDEYNVLQSVLDAHQADSWRFSAASLREKCPSPSVGLMLWHATHLSSPLRHLPVLIFRIQEVLAEIIPASLFALADIFYKTNTHLSGFGEFELCFLLTLW